MATQHALFDEADDGRDREERSLVARPQPGRPLSRQEQTFNRLVARVEKLRASFDREQQRLEDALVFHAAEIRPRVERVTALRQDVVRALLPFLKGPGLGKRAKQELSALLTEQLDEILANGGSLDGDLGQLFERLHGASVGELQREHSEEMRSELEGMFAELGLDIDLSGFRPDMTEEELAVKAAEMADGLKQQAATASQRDASGRTKKQQARAQQSEELRKASLGGIYRQLVKLLHPDLEPDPDARRHKEVLMQQITAAYAEHDLHTLLRLQFEWMHREDAGAGRLTSEKLRAYNEVLKEQADELSFAIDALFANPRYEPLMQDVGDFGVRILPDGPGQARGLDDLTSHLTMALGRLRGPDAIHEVRGALRERRQARRAPY